MGIKFLVFSDLHYEQMEDGEERLNTIIRAIKDNRTDFAVCLGDFCAPIDENKGLLERIRSAGVPIHFTVGNTELYRNDMQTTIDFWGMDKPYYSFETEDYKFISLNTNYYRDSSACELPFFRTNYKGTTFPVVPREEVEWLRRELEGDKKKIIFSHHSLVNEFQQRGVHNRQELHELFREGNVLLCMNGHDHGDSVTVRDGIVYYSMIAASYIWLGFQIDSDAERKEKYSYLNGMLKYRDPFYAVVEIDGSDVKIRGMEGAYQSVTPDDIGLHDYSWNGVSIRPQASSYGLQNDRS